MSLGFLGSKKEFSTSINTTSTTTRSTTTSFTTSRTTSITNSTLSSGFYSGSPSGSWSVRNFTPFHKIYWLGTNVANSNATPTGNYTGPVSAGGYQYYRGNYASLTGQGLAYNVYRTGTQTTNFSTSFTTSRSTTTSFSTAVVGNRTTSFYE